MQVCENFGYKYDNIKTSGHCASSEGLCAMVKEFPKEDVIPMSKTWKGLDKFDAEYWLMTHSPSVITMDEVKSVMAVDPHAIEEAEDDAMTCEHINDATLCVLDTTEHKISTAWTEFNYAENFVHKFILTLAKSTQIAQISQGTHIMMGMVFGMTIYTNALLFVQIPAMLFIHLIAKWSSVVQQIERRSEIAVSILSKFACLRTKLYDLDMQIPTDAPKIIVDEFSPFKNCFCQLKSLIHKSLRKIQAVMLLFEKALQCLTQGDPYGKAAQYQLDCFDLLLPSLLGVPNGLLTQFAVRVEIWALYVQTILSKQSELAQSLNFVHSFLNIIPGREYEAMGKHLEKLVNISRTVRVDKGSCNSLPEGFPGISQEKQLCGAFTIALATHTKLFEAFERTVDAYFKGRARQHWKTMSFNPATALSTFDYWWTTGRCKKVFPEAGIDMCSRSSFVSDNLPGYSHAHTSWFDTDKLCSKAMQSGPIFEEPKPSKREKRKTALELAL